MFASVTYRGVRDPARQSAGREGLQEVWAITLTDLNIWLDVAFPTLEVVVLIGFILHFVASIFVGRFRKMWLEGHWTFHDKPEAARPIMHVINLSSFVLLIFTGMYIRFPWFDGGRDIMRIIHYVAMTVVILNYLTRIWYAFFSKRRDYKEFAIGLPDIKSAIGVVSYYLYLKPDKPHIAKYNVLQKTLYVTLAVMIPVQAYTGLSLLQQQFVFGYSPRYLLTFWWASLFGGLAMAGAWMRLVHYTFNWLFIVMVTIHAYMALSQDAPSFWVFFGREWTHAGSEVWRAKRIAAGKPVPEVKPAHGEAH
jgi:Ni/Fe-hydrogenase 1 B-type cytochrome subunit